MKNPVVSVIKASPNARGRLRAANHNGGNNQSKPAVNPSTRRNVQCQRATYRPPSVGAVPYRHVCQKLRRERRPGTHNPFRHSKASPIVDSYDGGTTSRNQLISHPTTSGKTSRSQRDRRVSILRKKIYIHSWSKGNKIISICSQVFRSNSLYAVRRVIKMYTPKPELVELKYLVN